MSFVGQPSVATDTMETFTELKTLSDWLWEMTKYKKGTVEWALYKRASDILAALAEGELVRFEHKGRVSYSISIEEAEKLFPRLTHS